MRASPAILGLDIGGANLKAAHSDGSVRIHPFELWKHPTGLSDALQQLLNNFPSFERLAITMTGELCDCFQTKREGVLAILTAVSQAAQDIPVGIWRNDGSFVDLATARGDGERIAAANWLALAAFAGRWAPRGAGFVLDIGSTTTDIVPLWNGQPVPRGRTDPERTRTGELLYCGARRTPVCALLGAEGAAELFATTLDVYLLLGHIAENSADCGTADGRPATKHFAQGRLARMTCADVECCAAAEIEQLAQRICDRQVDWIAECVDTVSRSLPEPPETVVLSGSGEFLGRLALHRSSPKAIISVQERLGPAISAAACAYALALLASERPDLGA